jgi:uncharacterized repeat protein (TIGR01451 family)
MTFIQPSRRRSHRLVAQLSAPLVVLGMLPAALVTVGVVAAAPAVAAPYVAPSQVRDVNPDSVTGGNLFGGRNEALAVNPVNPQIVLAAVELGGVFKSTDAGAHWTHLDNLPLTRTEDVQYSASDPSLVIATGDYDGSANTSGAEAYRSTDGGNSWTRIVSSPCGAGNASNAHKVGFGAGTPGAITAFIGTDCGLIKSTDSGATWTNVNPIAPSGAGWFHDVKVRGTGPNYIVDTCSTSGFFRSTDGGTTWSAKDNTSGNPIQPGANNGALPCRVATAPGNSNVVFLVSVLRTPSPSTGINETQILENDNGGAAGSWVSLNGSSDGNGRPANVITAPGFDGNANHFEVFYATDQNFIHQQCDLSRLPATTCNVGDGNNGGAFSNYDSDVPHNAPDSSALAFGADGCPFLTSGDGGVFSTSNGCDGHPDFTPSNTGMHGLQSTGGAGTSYTGNTSLYFGTQDNGIQSSTNTGTAWAQSGPDVYGVFADQDGPGSRVLWKTCCSVGGGSVSSTLHVANNDLGGSSNLNPPPSPYNKFPAFGNILGAQFGHQRYIMINSDNAAAPATPNWRMYVTTNEGGSWTQLGADLPTGSNPGQVVASGAPASPTFYLLNTVGANPTRLFRVQGPLDGTATVTQIGTGLNGPQQIAASPTNPLIVWAIDSTGVKKSINGGASFTPDATANTLATVGGFSLNNGGFLTSLGVDGNSNTVMIGTVDNGIIVSTNNGGAWSRVRGSNLISRSTGFFFDEKTGKAYTSSAGRGMWEITLPHSDLEVTKTHSPDPVIAGQQLTWYVTVKNNGPDPAPDVTVTDVLPKQASYLTNNLNPPNGCTIAAPATATAGQTIACSVGDLDNGASITFKITTLVDKATVATAGGPTSITNNINTDSAAVIDTTPANNSASDTAIVNDSADLEVTKICKPDTTAYAGQPIDCTVYVDNHGPSDARGVVLTDVVQSNPAVPVTVSNYSAGCTSTPSSGGAKNTLVCDLGTVTAATTSDPGRKTISYRMTAQDQTDIDNVATVRSDTPDPDATNNKAQVNLTVTATADLALTASVPSTAVAGTDMTYNLSVTNSGPSKATNVIVKDALPAGVSLVSVTPSTGSCTAGTPGNPSLPTSCALGTINSGAPAVTIAIVVHVAPDTLGNLGHSARVFSDTFDANNSNDLADGVTVVSAQADLGASMAATPNPVVAGTTLTYRTSVSNNGPSVARSTTVSQSIPAGTTFTAYHLVGGTGSCALATPSQLGCSLGTLGLNKTVDVYVDVLVSPSTPKTTNLTSNATVSSAATDPGPTTNSASASSVVDTKADLSIANTSDKNVYKPSTDIHYLIVVSNAGPSDAQSVVVTIALPPAKTGYYTSNDAGCPPPSGTTFTCNLGTLAASGTKSFQLTFHIIGNKGTISTTASVSSPTSDPNTANNSSIRNVTVK